MASSTRSGHHALATMCGCDLKTLAISGIVHSARTTTVYEMR